MIVLLDNSFNNKFELRFRQLASTNAIKFDDNVTEIIERNNSQNITDQYAIAIYYNLDENQAIGLEFGIERYPQIFDHKNLGKYYQNPRIFWIGAGYKLSLQDLGIEKTLYPYTQLELCYTTIGPIIRPQVGLVFKPINEFSIFAGYEAAMLFYNVDGKILNSGKYGLIYGLSFNF